MYIVYSLDSDVDSHVIYYYSDYTEAKAAYDAHFQEHAFDEDDGSLDPFMGFALIKIRDGSGFEINEDGNLYFTQRFEVIEYSEGANCKLFFVQR
jgi:hypothetical protein